MKTRKKSSNHSQLEESQSENLTQPRRLRSQRDNQSQSQIDIQTVRYLVRFILNIMAKQEIIKKSDIVKHVLNDQNIGRKFDEILRLAQEKLISIYGLELYHIPNTAPNKHFIVINKLTENKIVILNQKERAEYTLLLIVLALVFMNDNSISEVNILSFLHELNIIKSENDFENDYFGNVKQLLNVTFIKKSYLITSKVSHFTQTTQSNNLNETIKFSWGPRAHKEITKKTVLQFVAKIFNKSEKSFQKFYKLVREEEEQNQKLAENHEILE